MKQEEIDTAQKRGAYTVTIIGCGREGLSFAAKFADAGFRTILADPDQSAVKRLGRDRCGISEREIESKLRSALRSGKLSATSDLRSAISQSDAIIVTINPKIDDKKNVDHAEVEKFLKQIGMNMKRGTVVIYTGIAGFGFMENIVKEALVNASGLKMGEDFGLAYNPIQVAKDTPSPDFTSNLEPKVAANDKISLNSASALIGTITKRKPQQAMNFKIAELARLFSAARRDANRALTNELAMFCENAGMDYLEVLKLVDSQVPAATLTPASGGEEASEVYVLLDNAEDSETKLRFARLARQMNEDMIKHAVNLAQSALRSCGRTLRRSKIVLVGPTALGTIGEKYAKTLEAKGARTSSFDPQAKTSERSNNSEKPKRSLNDAAESSDCIVFLEGQEIPKNLNLKNLKRVMRSPSAIIDLSGALEPEKAETEGFIYRGLGRGARKK